MRINKIEVNGFGKLSDFTMEFNDDITNINEINGWGKSTLAAFIRVMFYGFENESKQKLKEKEREHYRPWNASVYGGSIWFSVNGKNYYLNRIFTGKKDDEQFTLKNADTNMDTDDFERVGNNIGEAIFGVDSASFMRTSYISRDHYNSLAMEEGVSDRISAKLGRLTDDTNDVNNYENIKKKIKSATSGLTGKNGKVTTTKAEINLLEHEVLRKANVEKSLKEVNNHLDEERKRRLECECNLKKLDEEYRLTSDVSRMISLKDQYQGIKEKALQAGKQAEALRASLPENIPSTDQINNCLEVINNKDRLSAAYEECRLIPEELAKLAELKSVFNGNVPSTEDISSKLELIGSIKIDMSKLNTIDMSDDDIKRLEELKLKYSGKEGQLPRVEEAFSDINVRNGKAVSISGRMSKLEAAQNELKRAKEEQIKATKNSSTLMLAFGSLLALLGIAFILIGLKNIPVLALGAVMAVAGLALLVVSLIKKASASKKAEAYTDEAKESEIKSLEAIIDSDRATIDSIDAKIKGILEAFGLSYSEAEAFNKLSKLKDQLSEYKSLLDKEKKYKDSDLHRLIQDKKTAVVTYLESYRPLIQYEEAEQYLYELRDMKATYVRLSEKENKAEDIKKKIEESKATIGRFFEDFKLDMTKERLAIDELKGKISDYEASCTSAKEREAELEDFIKDKDMEAIEKVDSSTTYRSLQEISAEIDALKEELDYTNERISGYNDTKSTYVEELSDIEDKEAELAGKKEELEIFQSKQKILASFDKLFTDAKQNLSLRFTKPVLDGVNKYMDIVLDDKKELAITPDMSIQFREGGNFREPRNLSSGYQDFIDFALRMGLIDSMYEKDKPVLILDDPFTNLDAVKLSKVPKLLEVLAQKYQIIYFSCHASRGLE